MPFFTVAQTVPALAAAWFACLALPALAAEPDWPQWRGPHGDGHAPAAHDLPVTWSETENVVWRTPIPGRGWSSPVLANGQVWMTTAIERTATPEEQARATEGMKMAGKLDVADGLTIRAVCVDASTGKIVHNIELLTVTNPQPIHKLNSFASPSPVLGNGRLYVHCGDFGAACVDATTGKVLWHNRELRLNHENGPGSTPVLWNDKLIVHLDGSDVQSIAAYDTATGKVAWQTARSGALRDDPDLKKAYGTPIIVELGGRDVVISPAADWLYAYDPATGKELWKMPYGFLGFSIVPRPVTSGDLLYMSTSFNQPELLAVRLAGPTTAPEIAWQEKKGAPTMSSPLVVDDLVYMVSDKGVGTCLDAKTGEQVWSQRLGGNFSSSPLYADGRIYVSNRDGDTFVMKPGRDFDLLATNHLDGGIFATPAAVGRALFIRTEHALYRIEKPASSAKAAARRRGIPLGFDNFAVRACGWNARQLIDHAEKLRCDSLFITDFGPFEGKLDDASLGEIRRYADDRGVAIVLGSWSICPTSVTFKNDHGTAEEHLATGIRMAKALGSPAFRVVLGNRDDRKTEGGIKARIADTVAVLKSCRARAIDSNVRIAVENHAGDMTSRELAGLIAEAGEDFVGANFDSGNACWTLEDPVRALENLAPHVATTSLRDTMVWETPDGVTAQWTAMGEGCTDLVAFFDLFERACPGVTVHIETISGFSKTFPIHDREFQKLFPDARGEDMAAFLALAKRGHPIEPFKAPAGEGKRAAEREYQLAELARSIAFCRETLGLGLRD